MASANLKAELECSICLNIYTDPVTLKCAHNFCRGCIDCALDTQERSGSYSCPECREKFQKRPALQKNIKLRNIVENFLSAQSKVFCTYCVDSPITAVKSCLLCEASLCDKHLTVHSKSPEHVLCEPTTTLRNRKCSIHKELFRYYCNEESACICVSCCLIGEHKGHQMESLDEASEKRKETLKNVLRILRSAKESKEEIVRSLWEHSRKVQQQAAGETRRATALFIELRKRLEDLEKRVLREISGQAEQICHSTNDLIQQLEIKTAELSKKMRHIEELCNMTDPLTVLQESDTGTHWLAEIMKHLYTSKVTLTSPIEFGDISKLEELNNITTKRIIPTHFGYDMLPQDFKTKKCKAIYIIRNPKDTAVSLFHYYRDNPNLPTVDMWSTYFDMFLHGQVVYGSWFDHILSWEEHQNEMGTLFLYYESMKKNPFKSVRAISSYLGININDNEIHEICKKTSFSEMKTNAENEMSDPNHTVCSLTSNRKMIFRKGTVGDWKQYFSTKQNRLFEELYNTKMNASCLAKHIHYEN